MCRAEIPVSLLAVSWELDLAPEAAHILGLWSPPSMVKSNKGGSSAFHVSFFLLISLIPGQKFLHFKDACD